MAEHRERDGRGRVGQGLFDAVGIGWARRGRDGGDRTVEDLEGEGVGGRA